MEFNLNGPIIGFMYFVNLNVSFSIWFFYLLTTVEEGIFNRFGIGVTEGNAFVWGLPSTSWQSWGAFVFMVIWGAVDGPEPSEGRDSQGPSTPVTPWTTTASCCPTGSP